MKKNDIASLKSPEQCTRPEVGEYLADYLVDTLTDAAAEEFEEHLLLCRHCRENYLKIIRIRASARRKRAKAAANGNGAPHGANVLRLADFKK